MKTISFVFFQFILIMLLAINVSASTMGAVVTLTSEPTDIVQNNVKELKQDKISTLSILGLFAFGDSRIDALAKKAGITKIHHIDKDTFSILGIFVQETFTVYGE